MPGLRLVHLRGERVDLGGIGKGLALRMAAAQMRRAGRDFLIEAGGDVYAGGRASAAAPWRIGVESPFGDGDGDPAPVAVLEAENTALATSSTRVRSWVRDGRTVHHLIDPRTGEPARSGLAAVTVMHPDPVTAEAWSKSLFVAGLDAVAEVCGHRGLAALWVDTEGRMNTSAGMEKVVAWRAS